MLVVHGEPKRDYGYFPLLVTHWLASDLQLNEICRRTIRRGRKTANEGVFPRRQVHCSESNGHREIRSWALWIDSPIPYEEISCLFPSLVHLKPQQATAYIRPRWLLWLFEEAMSSFRMPFIIPKCTAHGCVSTRSMLTWIVTSIIEAVNPIPKVIIHCFASGRNTSRWIPKCF